MSGSESSKGAGQNPGGADDDGGQVTIGQLEDRSNRSSWRIMYVFIGVLLVLTAIVGFSAVMSQSGN